VSYRTLSVLNSSIRALTGSSLRSIVLLIIAAQAFLVACQFGLIPRLRYFWGFNLWQYLPLWFRLALFSGVLLFCWIGSRKAVSRALRAIAERKTKLHPRLLLGVVLVLVTAVLWQLRERHPVADSLILLITSQSDSAFLFPEMGATYLTFFAATKAGPLFALSPAASIQLLVCLFGGLTLMAMIRASEFLTPDREIRAFILAYPLSAGMARIFAGHIEVYAIVLCGGTVYLWTVCSYFKDKCSLALPCFVLGMNLWLHLQFLCLLPSVLALPVLKHPGRPLKLTPAASSLALVVAPTLVFLLAMYFAGHEHSLKAAWITCERILNLRPDPELPSRWVGINRKATTYALFSTGQLKYLLNAFYLLAPSAILVLPLFAVFSPKRLFNSPEARFLVIACVPLVLYAFALRPIWGPYDWDLFSLTALFLSFLAAHLLAAWLSERSRPDLAVWLIVAGLLLVAVPFLWIGISVSNAAGPFAPDRFNWSLFEAGTPAFQRFSLWL
jgi:hypothetical protein